MVNTCLYTQKRHNSKAPSDLYLKDGGTHPLILQPKCIDYYMLEYNIYKILALFNGMCQ